MKKTEGGYGMAAIIIYFSRTGENYFGGKIKSISKGNTEKAAEMIAELTGAKLFQVEPVVKYSDSYKECVAQAANEWKSGARPEIIAYPENMDAYDTIYLGYPNYCGTMPMVMFTLLEKIDTAGKIIKPLCTNEGSGLARSEEDIRQLCPQADVRKGLSIIGSAVEQAKPDIEKWLNA